MLANLARSGGNKSSYEVGDILVTARTDLDVKWHLCDGSAITDFNLISKVPGLAVDLSTANFSSVPILIENFFTYPHPAYWDGYYYDLIRLGNSTRSDIELYRISEEDALSGGEMEQIATLPGTTLPSNCYVYPSNDGYINITLGSTTSGQNVYYRYDTVTGTLGSAVNFGSSSQMLEFTSVKFGTDYYTLIGGSSNNGNSTLYVGSSFGSMTTQLRTVPGTFCYLARNYYSEKYGKAFFFSRYSTSSSIYCYIWCIDVNTQTVISVDSANYNYADIYEIPGTDYLCIKYVSIYGETSSSVKLLKMDDLTVTSASLNLDTTYYLDGKIQYVNGKYYYAKNEYRSSRYYVDIHCCDSIVPEITNDVTVRSGLVSPYSNSYGVLFLYKNGLIRTQYTSGSNKGQSCVAAGPTYPNITFTGAQAYIKVE